MSAVRAHKTATTHAASPHLHLLLPQFTQKKADGQVRWAVLNVAMLLRRYSSLQDKLAAAMAAGASVGGCVRLIESELAGDAEGILGPGEAEEAASAFVSSTSGGSTTGGSSAEASQQEP